MHVDRSRFLLLTASLALAACGSPKPKTSPEGKDGKDGKSAKDAGPKTDAAAPDAKAGEPSTPDTATPPGPKAGAGAGPGAAPGSAAVEGEEPSPVNES